MRHVPEIYLRFQAELRAIRAKPRVTPDDAGPAFVSVEDALNELARAADSAAYEIAAQKVREAVAFTHQICKSKATEWAEYESAFGSLKSGLEHAIERDKESL